MKRVIDVERGKTGSVVVDCDDKGVYYVFYDGVKRHSPCTAEDAMRALAHYLQSAFYKIDQLESLQENTVIHTQHPVDFLPIGTLVMKHSKKPFKSGSKFNTIAGYRSHPVTKRPCYTFQEDNTYVEAHQCEVPSADYLEEQKDLQKGKLKDPSIRFKLK